MIISSDRSFGVEIEFFCPTPQLIRSVSNKLNVVGDGSIRHIPNSGEFVSDILRGKTGENNILRSCEILKKHNASCDDTSMSVHIHLDGRRNTGRQLVSSPTVPENCNERVSAFSNKVARELGDDVIRAILSGDGGRFVMSLNRTIFDGIVYYSLGELDKKPTKNFTFYYLNSDSRFKWLRNVMFFYTQYSEVMENIVSNSRKLGNMYCTPLSASYTLDSIRKVSSMNELRTLWYKGNESGGHYDDSRYHNVNLHAYWNRHGTVEIRSHGGTIDAGKILLWIKLHQKILDKLETMELDEIELRDNTNIFASFLSFIEEPVLQSYVKRLLGFYSNIIIK